MLATRQSSADGAKANREKNSSCRKALLLPLRDKSFYYGKVAPAQALQLTRSGPSFSQDTRPAQFLQIYKIKQTGKRKQGGGNSPAPRFCACRFLLFHRGLHTAFSFCSRICSHFQTERTGRGLVIDDFGIRQNVAIFKFFLEVIHDC